MTNDKGGDWGGDWGDPGAGQQPAADPEGPGEPETGQPPTSSGPAPGSPEADALARTVGADAEAPQRRLNSASDNEPKQGVRLPIVIAVIVGIAVTFFIVQGRIPTGGSPANFNEACVKLELGTASFEAREQLTRAAAAEGMVGVPEVRVEGSVMMFAFRPPGAQPNMVRACRVQLSKDGRSVVNASLVR